MSIDQVFGETPATQDRKGLVLIMKPEDIRTRADLVTYIGENASKIYVRDEVNGKWGSYSLIELRFSKALGHAFRFIDTGRLPIAVVDEDGN